MDLIDRQAAIEALKPCAGVGNRALDKLRALPSAEPKMGHWIKISPAGIYECSQCGQNVMTGDIEVYTYCHHCGAEMKEDTDA